MLQRVQTYYLGLIILIQVVAISGLDFLKFNTEENYHVLNAWGMTTYPRTDHASDSHFIPCIYRLYCNRNVVLSLHHGL